MKFTEQITFYKLLLSELRLIPVTFTEDALSEANLVCAVTANEELSSLGWTLSPADTVKLSRCEELRSFPAYVRNLMEDVTAKPMYPDFPKQVMEMSEAKFRFHQMLHYLSTYGMETVTGEPVLRGWLPNEPETEKTQEPAHLLKARTVQLIDIRSAAYEAFCRILSKNERMTLKETQIIGMCLPVLTAEQITSAKVPFKENLTQLFSALTAADALSAELRRLCICGICQHTGDVWKCIDSHLRRRRYHFRTAEKRLFVKVLESYPIGDFRTNLMLSNLRRERILLLLKFIDYNTYSRSREHKDAVRMLRAGELHSWESDVIRRVRSHAPDTLAFIAQRPGMMLRMMTLLLRSGFSKEEIAAHLKQHAAELRTQTIVTMLNKFAGDPAPVPQNAVTDEHIRTWEYYIETDGSVLLPESVTGKDPVYAESKGELHKILDENRKKREAIERRNAEFPVLAEICKALLGGNLAAKAIPYRGKKAAFRFGEFAPEHSMILTNDKSDEGGYIPSGVAYRIPETAERIRFFVYWNDKERVDVDLHVTIRLKDGRTVNGGWNSKYIADCMAFSGDITHSDAAEYFDIDLTKGTVDYVTATVHVYRASNKGFFSDIETCYVGCMAVRGIGEKVKLYSPANCIFTHVLKSNVQTMQYGYVDAVKHCVVFIGQPVAPCNWNSDAGKLRTNFSMQEYLEILCRAQGMTVVPEDQADVIFVLGKPNAENEISLKDCNYFMDTPNN